MACNTQLCLGRVKACPGSSPVDDSTGVSAVVCSGHGSCSRSPSSCREGDVYCVAVCQCRDGWAGLDCGETSEELSAKQLLRSQMLDVLVRVGVCERVR